MHYLSTIPRTYSHLEKTERFGEFYETRSERRIVAQSRVRRPPQTVGNVPLPVILVVGTFEGDTRGGRFAQVLWDAIAGESVEHAGEEGIALTDSELERIRTQTGRYKWAIRPLDRSPIPIRLSDRANARSPAFEDKLRELLRRVHVWGIIAAGDADNTTALRDLLTAVDIPVLVATDSTMAALEFPHVGELRLGPTNDWQARDIVVTCRQELGRRKREILIESDTSPSARPYVNDLRKALKAELESHGLRTADASGNKHRTTPRIMIGYSEWAVSRAKAIPDSSIVVWSDGCWSMDLLRIAKRRRCKNWWWCRPGYNLADIGRDAYSALATVGRELCAIRDQPRRDEIRGDLYVTRIREELRRKGHQFEGRRCTSLRYAVKNVRRDALRPPREALVMQSSGQE
jgi:hypothetical protein